MKINKKTRGENPWHKENINCISIITISKTVYIQQTLLGDMNPMILPLQRIEYAKLNLLYW